jgi:hypothetical protein
MSVAAFEFFWTRPFAADFLPQIHPKLLGVDPRDRLLAK